MKTKKIGIFLVILIILAGSVFYIAGMKQQKTTNEVVKEINPAMGSIRTFISSTGTILPKNRLEIKPPVNGRIERILVKEGDGVKTGDILAWMSSTERAALLDAARGKGEQAVNYWENAYKAIPLIAPIDSEVIVATTQPGQTVTTSDPVVVLSDRLIVRAQVDETDIGKVALDKKAFITIDAYPDTKIEASVEHIYYESETVNNVTVYKVDLAPEDMPKFFRSGMNASIDFIDQSKENTLLVPVEAVYKEKEGNYVLVKQGYNGELVRAAVKLGISDDKNVEVLSGITKDDRIIIKSKMYNLPKDTRGKNPFMPGH
ncbi:MAG: HlyD family efflux transporter periplasmic adaptor subunit [Candidatus Omnitrophica bacterium]|nr:HlyD family efflux transporter periplasmic adaptor subunit [Candidatus Omnitrophota bacterium]